MPSLSQDDFASIRRNNSKPESGFERFLGQTDRYLTRQANSLLALPGNIWDSINRQPVGDVLADDFDLVLHPGRRDNLTGNQLHDDSAFYRDPYSHSTQRGDSSWGRRTDEIGMEPGYTLLPPSSVQPRTGSRSAAEKERDNFGFLLPIPTSEPTRDFAPVIDRDYTNVAPINGVTVVDAPYVPSPPRLVGVEPNPGPPKRSARKKKGTGKSRKAKRNGNGNRTAQFTQRGSGGSSSGLAPVASFNGNMSQSYTMSTVNFLGTRATLVRGRHVIAEAITLSDSTIWFQMGGANGSIMYANPRICCQIAPYGTVVLNCPLNRIATAYGKFCFTRLRLVFDATAPTSTAGQLVIGYTNAVASSYTQTASNLKQLEVNQSGPAWRSFIVDATPVLDRSKWWDCETTNLPSDTEVSFIQGAFLIAGTSLGASLFLGTVYMEYEIAFMDMEPYEIVATPAFILKENKSLPVESTSDPGESKTPPSELHLSKDEESDESLSVKPLGRAPFSSPQISPSWTECEYEAYAAARREDRRPCGEVAPGTQASAKSFVSVKR